jgi:hypothetical protein
MKPIIQSKLGVGEGMRVAHNLFTSLLDGFQRRSLSYMNCLNEPPFAESEKQLHTMLAPTFDALAEVFLMEYPLRRKSNSTENVGWVDYWCRYRGFDFMIEVKHHHIKWDAKNPHRLIHRGWKHIHDAQLKPIHHEMAWLSAFNKGVFPCALHISTVDAPEKSDYHAISNQLKLLPEKFMTELIPAPNWTGIWILDEQEIRQSIYPYGSGKSHPAVLFTVGVEPLVRKEVKAVPKKN